MLEESIVNNFGKDGCFMTNFQKGYKKFTEFIDKTDLIPNDRNKVIVAYSGGKDASLICNFLCEYKKNKRPDLDIEMVTAQFPHFLYDNPNAEVKQKIDQAVSYWGERGISFHKLDVKNEYSDTILNVDSPCRICSLTKTTILSKFARSPENKHSIFCMGFNLDDSLGWFIEILLLTGNFKNWMEVQKENPKLYHELLMLSTRISHRIYSKSNDVLFIRPIINFTNDEIAEITAERNLPLIPENCKEITKRDVFYDSPRRDISNVLAVMRKKHYMDFTKEENPLYDSYFESCRFFQYSNLIPPQNELNSFMSDNLMI